MKKKLAKKASRRPSAKIADTARVRLGSMSPSFTASAPTKEIADTGKVRLGSMSPSF